MRSEPSTELTFRYAFQPPGPRHRGSSTRGVALVRSV